MENETDSGPTRDDEKLFGEWSQSADHQVVLMGLGVLLILVLVWGGSRLLDSGPLADAADNLRISLDSDKSDPGPEQALSDFEAAIPQTTLAPEPEIEVGDLAGAMSEFGVTGIADGDLAILTGYVATAADSAAAEAAATRVPGINTVNNKLVILEPLVKDALANAGVSEFDETTVLGTTPTVRGYVDDEPHRGRALLAVAGVNGVTGTVVDELIALDADVLDAITASGVEQASVSVTERVATVSGQVADEASRDQALDAALVFGISEVIDDLTIAGPVQPPAPEGSDTRDKLNALFEANPIQFNSGSAVIKQESFEILDQAVELLSETDASFEVQGYTDTTGSAASNQRLSEGRAEAVVDYLVSKGVASAKLEAKGYGPTEQFGSDLAANRRVRFELI